MLICRIRSRETGSFPAALEVPWTRTG